MPRRNLIGRSCGTGPVDVAQRPEMHAIATHGSHGATAVSIRDAQRPFGTAPSPQQKTFLHHLQDHDRGDLVLRLRKNPADGRTLLSIGRVTPPRAPMPARRGGR